MPVEVAKPKTDREAKLFLGGRRSAMVYGVEVVYRPQKGTALSSREIKRAIFLGRVSQYKSWIEPILKDGIESMGEMTHVDLWRDPQIAMELYRKVVA